LPEAPQRVRKVLLELVAVHRALLEEPQDGQFEHRGSLPLDRRVARIWRLDISAVYIETIYGRWPSVNQPSRRGGPRPGTALPGPPPRRARPAVEARSRWLPRAPVPLSCLPGPGRRRSVPA